MKLFDWWMSWFRREGVWHRREPMAIVEEKKNEPSPQLPPSGKGSRGAASQRDIALMTRAIELARQAAAMGEVPVGAVVYRTASGEVLGEGFNRREADKDPSAHAEYLAIQAACKAIGDWRLNDCTLVVTLEPCAMCAGLIVNARVGRVIYGASDPKAGAVRTLYEIADDARLNHRSEVVGGVMAEECASLLRSFFRGLRAR